MPTPTTILVSAIITLAALLQATSATSPITVPTTAPATAPADRKMVRMVVSHSGDAIQPGTFPAQPRTMYRVGRFRARIEEPPDPAQGMHMLIISNDREHWMINRLDSTGMHVLDDAEDFQAHLPIIDRDAPPPLNQLEFGEELQFMTQHGAKGKVGELEGTRVEHYHLKAGDTSADLFVDATTRQPRILRIVEGGKKHYVRYVEYEAGLAPDEGLFQLPPDIRVREAREAATRPATTTEPAER